MNGSTSQSSMLFIRDKGLERDCGEENMENNSSPKKKETPLAQPHPPEKKNSFFVGYLGMGLLTCGAKSKAH